MSSQQVVDFVRLKVSEGMELSAIGELMCDHCLAPDTNSGAGIGCDNMTVLIVALLHGRTKQEWYSWITDRVNKDYGYETPKTLPPIYSQSRLMSFKARREANESRERSRQDQDDSGSGGFLGSSTLGGFARVLGSTGGISFHPGSNIMSDTGALMFGNEDSGDDSGDEDNGETRRSIFGNSVSESLGLKRSASPDPTKHLKAQLDEFEKDIREEDGTDEDGDSILGDVDEDVSAKSGAVGGAAHRSTQPTESSKGPPLHIDGLQGEAPPPSKPQLNGDTIAPVAQLESQPGGDSPSPAVKAEGLLDASESPTKM